MAPLDLGLEIPTGARPPAHRAPKRRGQPRLPARSPLAEAWALEAGINVVLFAGLGGACEGIEDAGFPVHLAVNHDAVAIAVHKHRNPHTHHLQTDVFEVDPREATRGRPVNILWASPDCRHHSRAKGGKPVSNRVRSLPWIVCRWMGQVRPARVFIENVREIRSWCPLIAKRDRATGRVLKLDGTVAAKGERVPVQQQQLVPNSKKKGRTFRAWQRHQRGLGYTIEDMDRVCADFGIPTTRTRFWEVAVRADTAAGPIVWRAPTHAPRQKAAALGLLPWAAAASIIDWSIPMRSIFGRKKDHAVATLRRIARCVMKFVVTAAEPFTIPVTHSGTAANDGRGRSTAEPLLTQTTARGGEIAVVTPMLSAAGGRSAQSPDRDPREPLNTSTTKEDRIIVAAGLTPRFGERDGQDPRCRSIENPAPTQVNTGNGGSLIAAALTKLHGGDRGDTRGHEVTDALRTQDTENRFGVVAVGLQPNNANNQPVDVEDPAPPFTTGGRNMLVAGFLRDYADAPLDPIEPPEAIQTAWMVQHNTGETGHDMQHPVSTMVQKMCTQALASAALAKLRGTCRDGQTITAPMPTLSALGNHVALILPFLMKYYKSGGQDQAADQPLDALTTKARFGLVTVLIAGITYAITDILMRMLEPEEGAAAHSFRAPYFPATIEIIKNGMLVRHALTKAEKMALVGNSVPPPMAKILVEDNCPRTLAGQATTRAMAEVA